MCHTSKKYQLLVSIATVIALLKRLSAKVPWLIVSTEIDGKMSS